MSCRTGSDLLLRLGRAAVTTRQVGVCQGLTSVYFRAPRRGACLLGVCERTRGTNSASNVLGTLGSLMYKRAGRCHVSSTCRCVRLVGTVQRPRRATPMLTCLRVQFFSALYDRGRARRTVAGRLRFVRRGGSSRTSLCDGVTRTCVANNDLRCGSVVGRTLPCLRATVGLSGRLPLRGRVLFTSVVI